ncbi:MAG: ATP-dependent DNA ligase [Microbacteriaceae bacterium]
MGKLVYADGSLQLNIDDRVLAHLQIVIVAKLRRDEGFVMSWKDDISVGDGRSSIWLHRAVPLYFKFDSSEAPIINREWVEILTVSANSAAGLRLVEEPASRGESPA